MNYSKKNGVHHLKEDEFLRHSLEILKHSLNAGGTPHFSSETQDLKIQIRPDKTISSGMFKADPEHPGDYLAHPLTIRAMKKNIFAAGAELFVDLASESPCAECHKILDWQFWHFCPYCEAKPPQS